MHCCTVQKATRLLGHPAVWSGCSGQPSRRWAEQFRPTHKFGVSSLPRFGGCRQHPCLQVGRTPTESHNCRGGSSARLLPWYTAPGLVPTFYRTWSWGERRSGQTHTRKRIITSAVIKRESNHRPSLPGSGCALPTATIAAVSFNTVVSKTNLADEFEGGSGADRCTPRF